ncbi:MAG: hypothetical protein E7310_08825 [Clostridiales bacterium]|nr:hypothetical protein [Clostridiales bacterium]
MNNEFVHKILSEKITKNKEIIKIRIDDVNLSIQDTCDFIRIAKKELEEMGYKIYSAGKKYIVKNKEFVVGNGEVIVAVK